MTEYLCSFPKFQAPNTKMYILITHESDDSVPIGLCENESVKILGLVYFQATLNLLQKDTIFILDEVLLNFYMFEISVPKFTKTNRLSLFFKNLLPFQRSISD